MHRARMLILVGLALLIAACSMRSAIDAMMSPEDRAYAEAMVDHLRRGDSAWLERQFRPDLWEQSGKQIASVPGMFPSEPGTTELVSFNTSTNISNGRRESRKDFTLVTHGGGRWTVTNFETYAEGGRAQVVAWRVTPHSAPPPELQMLNAVDSALPWIWGGLIFVLIAAVAIIVLIVRSNRRKREAWAAAQRSGTPPGN